MAEVRQQADEISCKSRRSRSFPVFRTLERLGVTGALYRDGRNSERGFG
jgi:hypothetical protein